MKKHKKHCLKGKKGNDIALKWTKGDPQNWRIDGKRGGAPCIFVVNSARPYPHADKESAENTFAPRGAYANI